MNKSFKLVGFIISLLLATFLFLAITQPKDTTIRQSITIGAPWDSVYREVVSFKSWEHWSPWIEIEPRLQLQYYGGDAKVGSGYHWQGDEIGSGKMECVALTRDQLFFSLQFKRPWKGSGDGNIRLTFLNGGSVRVEWTVNTHVRFPLNAFSFISKKRVSKDLSRGLLLLKQYCESAH